VTTFNSLMRGLFDALVGPFRDLPAWVSLAVFGLVSGVVVLLIYKVSSNQEGLGAVKRRIHAGLFEIRLFNDDFRAIMRAQGSILKANLTYLRLSLAPMIWLLPIFVVMIIQLEFHYGYAGLVPGQPVLVEAQLKEGAVAAGEEKPAARLEAPAGLRIETPAVWAAAERTLTWRIAAEKPGDYDLAVALDGQRFTKSVEVAQGLVRRSPRRVSAGFLDQLLYPAEDPLPADSPIESIAVGYPPADTTFFGGASEWRWMIDFFVLSAVFAFALRGRFGVNL
jgi:hypothetical protein